MKKATTISISIKLLINDALESYMQSQRVGRSKVVEEALIAFLKDSGFYATPVVPGLAYRSPRGGQAVNLTKEKPWERLGISRRTFYRRYRSSVKKTDKNK